MAGGISGAHARVSAASACSKSGKLAINNRVAGRVGGVYREGRRHQLQPIVGRSFWRREKLIGRAARKSWCEAWRSEGKRPAAAQAVEKEAKRSSSTMYEIIRRSMAKSIYIITITTSQAK